VPGSYVAPEIVNGERYGQAVDVWIAGVITYILLGGYPPFYDDDPRKLYRKIRTAGYRFHSPKWDHVSAEAKVRARI
jgi:serine/threonine protein kinase